MAVDTSELGWKNWEEVGDIMGPYEAQNDMPQPDDEGARNWREKVAQEERKRYKRRFWPALRQRGEPKQKKAPESVEKKRGVNPTKMARLWIAAQAASYLAVLLAAPLISRTGGFYLLVLFLSVPVTAGAFLLPPLNRWTWMLRTLAPLLPVEAWFAMRYFSWDPWTTLALAGLTLLCGVLYFVIALRGKKPAKAKTKNESAKPKLNLVEWLRARSASDAGERQAEKERKQRLLLFIPPLMCAALLIPALLGLDLQLRSHTPAAKADPELQRNEAYMMERMGEAYRDVLPGVWESLERDGRVKALQALLDVETDHLKLPRYNLRDPAVLFIDTGKDAASVSALLHSGKDKVELRVVSLCRLAWRLRQMQIAGESDTASFNEYMTEYGKSRYIDYMQLWGGHNN